jgi:hypothetical protein
MEEAYDSDIDAEGETDDEAVCNSNAYAVKNEATYDSEADAEEKIDEEVTGVGENCVTSKANENAAYDGEMDAEGDTEDGSVFTSDTSAIASTGEHMSHDSDADAVGETYDEALYHSFPDDVASAEEQVPHNYESDTIFSPDIEGDSGSDFGDVNTGEDNIDDTSPHALDSPWFDGMFDATTDEQIFTAIRTAYPDADVAADAAAAQLEQKRIENQERAEGVAARVREQNENAIADEEPSAEQSKVEEVLAQVRQMQNEGAVESGDKRARKSWTR